MYKYATVGQHLHLIFCRTTSTVGQHSVGQNGSSDNIASDKNHLTLIFLILLCNLVYSCRPRTKSDRIYQISHQIFALIFLGLIIMADIAVLLGAL
jgi:hypothetical protein